MIKNRLPFRKRGVRLNLTLPENSIAGCGESATSQLSVSSKIPRFSDSETPRVNSVVAVPNPDRVVPGFRSVVPETPQSCQIATHTPAIGENEPTVSCSGSQYRAAGEPSRIQFFPAAFPTKQNQVVSRCPAFNSNYS